MFCPSAPWDQSYGRGQNFNLTSDKIFEQVAFLFTKVGGIWLGLWHGIVAS